MSHVHVQLIKRKRKLPSGKSSTNWMLRWFTADGRPQHESLGRTDRVKAKDAKAARAERESDLNNGRALRNRPQRITLAKYLADDRKSMEGTVRGSTLIEHKHASNHAIAALGETIELTEVGFVEVGKITAHLRDKGRAPATVKKTLGTLRAAFNRALKRKLVHENPFSDLRMPKVEARSKRIFTTAEADAMIAATDDPWWKVLIRTAITSGLRKDELLNLHWSDIDESANTITVQPKGAEAYDIGGRSYSTWAWFGKASCSYRVIPIADETVEALQRLRLKSGGSPYVFIGLRRLAQIQRHLTDGKLPLKFDLVPNMLRDFRRIQAKAEAAMNATCPAGQPVRWKVGSIHDLRRSYCTIMAYHVPLHVLKQWAGHSDIKTTSDFYLGMASGQDDQARRAITLTAG